MFCLVSFPRVWWYLVLYLSLSAILSLFLCMVWEFVSVSWICMQLSRFPSNTCWKDCLFPILCSCLICQRLIDHRFWTYFCILYSVPLVYMSVFVQVPHFLDYCGFISLWPEVWESYASCLVFISQDCFGDSGSFPVPYKCLDCLF